MTTYALAALVPLHLGALHPFERFMVYLLAFGPFVVLAIVVHVVRSRDLAEEAAAASSEGSAGDEGAGG